MNNLQNTLQKKLTTIQSIIALVCISTFTSFVIIIFFVVSAVEHNTRMSNIFPVPQGDFSSSVNTTNCSVGQARAIKQFDIEWTFDKCYAYGTFANGDYWIVGPAIITSITPESVSVPTTRKDGTTFSWVKNGTMINPKPSPDNASLDQGFDNTITFGAKYSPVLNVSPSRTGDFLVVPTHTSVLSSISNSHIPANASDYKKRINTMAVLTILPSPAPEGSFRPSISGNDKSIKWNKSQLDYSILKNLPHVATMPALSIAETRFEKLWQTQWEGNQHQGISPTGNMPNYGRDQAHEVGVALLSLHLNYSNEQKEKLYIRIVQYGLDIYGTQREVEEINSTLLSRRKDGFYRGSGGLNVGRKAPMVLAGLALNDSDIKKWSDGNQYKIFHEDKQTFYVTESDVTRARQNSSGVGEIGCSVARNSIGYCSRPLHPYTIEHTSQGDWKPFGMPEWLLENYDILPYRAGSNWNAYYRNINGNVFVSNALGIMLTEGGKDTWNWPAFFDYTERFYQAEKNNAQESTNSIKPFVVNMWESYLESNPAEIAPSILTHPLAQTIAQNTSVTLSVTANGTQPITYQWYKNNQAITGATGVSYITPPLQARQDAVYYVQVSNGAGSINSNTAQITISPQTFTCPNTPENLQQYTNSQGCIVPRMESFDIKSEISDADLNAVPNFEIGIINKARIQFNAPINLNFENRIVNLEDIIIIEDKKIIVNTQIEPRLNIPATITFYNVETQPKSIVKDGVLITTPFVYDAQNRTVTFTVSGFSVYELFFEEEIDKLNQGSSVTTSTTSSSGKRSAPQQIPQLSAPQLSVPPASVLPTTMEGLQALLVQLQAQLAELLLANTISQSSSPIFNRDLYVGMVGEDVRQLQILLNKKGYNVNTSPFPGSLGHESTYFGNKTQLALIKYQQANRIYPSRGYFGPITRQRLLNSE